MTMKKAITLILTGKVPLINVWYFIQGHARYKLYYSKYKWLLRKHIREQIDFRIKAMRPTCYINGSCDVCGCQTTMLQMANKACEGNCYPKMLKAGNWEYIKRGWNREFIEAYPLQNTHVK
jgi:hypothetical protein